LDAVARAAEGGSIKTLGEIISIRQNKYNKDKKNPSYTDFFQGYFAGWYSAYRDLKEILEQNGFDMSVLVIKEEV